VIEVRIVEDCFEESQMRDLMLDRALTADAIRGIGRLGVLQYYPDFPHPFFRVVCDSETRLKGVEGTKRIRAIFDCRPRPEVIEDLARSIEEASSTDEAPASPDEERQNAGMDRTASRMSAPESTGGRAGSQGRA
jgi:hypothetical protein